MIKELVCADCGCEDVKLVSETVKIQAHTGFSNILWLIISVIPIAVGITALCISFSTYWKAMQGNSTLSAENIAYISKMFFIGCIACFAGIFLILITLVLYLYNTYETETQL